MLISDGLVHLGIGAVAAGNAFFPVCYSYRDAAHTRGWWRHTGYGNVMLSRTVFDQAGRWPELQRWGGEDDQLHARVRERVPVVRTTVAGLFHQWHPNDLAWKNRYTAKAPKMKPSRPHAHDAPRHLLAWLVHRVTGETGRAGCGCDRRRRAMDRWGWRKCWQRRHQIIAWVVEEARLRGHEVERAHVASLILAALRELRQRKGADAEPSSTPESA